MKIISIMSKVAILMVSMLLPGLVHAQSNYPERPVRLVIPFAPGGNTDIVGRVVGARLTPLLGQQVVVENKGGAGGIIGAAEVARAKPDGYTLLIGNASTHAINPFIGAKPPYDPVKDFSPIHLFGLTSMGIMVHPTIARTLSDLLKRVKANPRQFSYGSCGVGSICHLSGEMFKKIGGGLDITHVPYRSSGLSLVDVVSGQIPISVATYSSAARYHKSGRLRILAIFSEKRPKDDPDLPTAIEQGLPDMLAFTFTILIAPANTPKPIIDRLSQSATKLMDDQSFIADLEKLSVEPVSRSSPDMSTQFISREINRWQPIIKSISKDNK